METRANHLLIGTFVLVMVAAVFGFVVWLAKVDVDSEFASYHIFFDGSVAGLSGAGEVRYTGIPVGSVTEIVIDPDNPRRVRVEVELAGTTPVREDTDASLEPRGITGTSYINLQGGAPESPTLLAKEGEPLPVIDSKPSAFQELFRSAPEAIDRFIVLANQAAKFLDEKNRVAVAGIIADVKVFTGALAERSDAIGETLDNVQKTSAEMREAAASIRGMTGQMEELIVSADETMAVMRGTLSGMDDFVTQDAAALIADARGLISDTGELMGDAQVALKSVARTSDEVHGVIVENRQSIKVFAGEGLFELSRFVTEARFLIASLSRLAERLETDPAQFLFGDTEQGFEAE